MMEKAFRETKKFVNMKRELKLDKKNNIIIKVVVEKEENEDKPK